MSAASPSIEARTSFRRKPESRKSKALDAGFRRCDESSSVFLTTTANQHLSNGQHVETSFITAPYEQVEEEPT
jgi:hypothetical protein